MWAIWVKNAATGFEWLHKVQNIAKSGHTGPDLQWQSVYNIDQRPPTVFRQKMKKDYVWHNSEA